GALIGAGIERRRSLARLVDDDPGATWHRASGEAPAGLQLAALVAVGVASVGGALGAGALLLLHLGVLPLLAACIPDLVPVLVDPQHDFDHDGFDEDHGDCDDGDPALFPDGLDEICGDGVDQDCSGTDALCAVDGTMDAADLDVAWPAPVSLAWAVGDHGGGPGDEILLVSSTLVLAS